MHALAGARHLGVGRIDQALALPDQMRPAAQAPAQVAVGLIAIGHQVARKFGRQHIRQDLETTRADEEQGGEAGHEHPQPVRLARLFPRGFVGVEQDGLLDVEDHFVFQRHHGAPGWALRSCV